MSNLIVIEKVKAVDVFNNDGLDPILDQLREEALSVVPNLKTIKGRKEVASIAAKVAKSKTFLDKLGKDLVADQKASIKLVDNERKRMREALDDLKQEVRKPLTDWEEEQKKVVAEIQCRYDEIANLALAHDDDFIPFNSTALIINLETLEAIVVDDSFGEMELQAIKAQRSSVEQLHELIEDACKKEAEAIELEKLRAEKEARDKRDYEENLKRQAAEAARLEAETKAKAEQDKIEEEKQAALAAQEESKRQAEEAEQQRIQAEERAKRQEEAAKKHAAEAEARAKQAAIDAEINAKRQAEAAIERERQRVIKQQADEENARVKRENNKRHNKKINNEALACLVSLCNLTKDQAKDVVTMIAKGEIKNININY